MANKRLVVYEKQINEERPGDTHNQGQNIPEDKECHTKELHWNLLIKEARNYDEHGEGKTKRPRKSLLQNEEDMWTQ